MARKKRNAEPSACRCQSATTLLWTCTTHGCCATENIVTSLLEAQMLLEIDFNTTWKLAHDYAEMRRYIQKAVTSLYPADSFEEDLEAHFSYLSKRPQ